MSAKELNRKTRWIRLFLGLGMLVGFVYGSYTIWWKETVIHRALETPEGRRALAEAMIEASKKSVN